MKKTAFTTAILILLLFNTSYSQTPSMGQIQKSQQDLEADKALREQAEKGQKVLIKKIVVKGATLVTEDKLKQITLPFNNHWLAQSDIDLLINSIANIYKQSGYKNQPAKISYKVKDGNLDINIEEAKR